MYGFGGGGQAGSQGGGPGHQGGYHEGQNVLKRSISIYYKEACRDNEFILKT